MTPDAMNNASAMVIQETLVKRVPSAPPGNHHHQPIHHEQQHAGQGEEEVRPDHRLGREVDDWDAPRPLCQQHPYARHDDVAEKDHRAGDMQEHVPLVWEQRQGCHHSRTGQHAIAEPFIPVQIAHGRSFGRDPSGA